MRQHLSFIVFIIFTFLTQPCFAKNDLPELQPIKDKYIGQALVPMMKKDKWGYVNTEGKFLIKPAFEAAKEYSDGLAYIKFGGKWGIINTIPAYVVIPTYDEINNFEGEIAIVSNAGKYGIIDKSGKLRLPVDYSEIRRDSYFANISFVCKDGLWDFIDSKTGQLKYKMGYAEIITNDGPYAKIKKDGKWGLMNKDIKYVTPIAYDQLKYNAADYYSIQQNGLYGAINTNGEYLLPCEFAQEPQLSSELSVYLAKGKVYFTNVKETKCWALNYNFTDPQLSTLVINSGESLVEQSLDKRTKLTLYNNLPAYITYDDKCVWAANDKIKSQVNKPLSMEFKEDSVQLANYFRANKDDGSYSMEQDINIKYPTSANDFRINVAKLQKTIFHLCTDQDLSTPAKVVEYYIGGYHIGYCQDYDWIPIPQLQVSLAKNKWKSALHASILSAVDGIMKIKVQKSVNFDDAQPNAESTIYLIDMKSGELLSKE